jgi:hypothetical protein
MGIRTFALNAAAATSVLGFMAMTVVAATTSGWLPFEWFVGGVNPNRHGMNKEPFLPSDLGVWVLGAGILCFVLGALLWAYLASRQNADQEV